MRFLSKYFTMLLNSSCMQLALVAKRHVLASCDAGKMPSEGFETIIDQ